MEVGLDKSIAQLPRAIPNFGWASDFLSRPEKCIEYIGNIIIPSYLEGAKDCRASG